MLAAIGLLRLFSDLLTDIDPTWVTILGDSSLRYLARTTDGSLAGDLNVQYFKVMAIPCGLAVIFLVSGGLTGVIAAAERRWASRGFRLTCILAYVPSARSRRQRTSSDSPPGSWRASVPGSITWFIRLEVSWPTRCLPCCGTALEP